jgi:hypothetical protein
MKPIKITFTNNFLNTFEGTQQELDSIVEELKAKFAAGEFEEFFENTDPNLTIGTGSEDELYQQPRVLH